MQSSHAESQIDGGKLKNIRHEKIYVSGTGWGNGLEIKNKIKNTAFPVQEVFQLTTKQEPVKGEYFLWGKYFL